MAQRRMLNIDLILDDSFIQDLSLEAQNMYIYLNMLADDDGIINHLNRNLRMLGKGQTPVNELIEAGFINRYDDQTIFITDWLVNNHLRKDRYSQSKAAECRDALYIDYNWKYTLDSNSEKVVIKYSKWIDQDRKIADKPINKLSLIDMKELAEYNYQKRIKDTGNQAVTSTAPSGNQSVTEWLHLGIGKGSGQVKGQGSVKGIGKGKGTKYINSSSNGGMGEILLGQQFSTSTIDNNATKESEKGSVQNSSTSLDNKEVANNDTPINDDDNTSSCLVDSNKQSTSQSGKQSTKQCQDNELQSEPNNAPSNDAKDLFNYLNTVFNIHIPSDERLSVLFEELSNQYQQQYIEQAIDQLADSLGSNNWDYRTVKNMVLSHLADTVKAVVKH